MPQTYEHTPVGVQIEPFDYVPQLDVSAAVPEIQRHAHEDLLAAGKPTRITQQCLRLMPQSRLTRLKQKLQELGMITKNEVENFLHPALMPACPLPIQHNGLL